MSDDCDHAAIFREFASRSTARRERAIHDAYIDAHADELLARMLEESPPSFAKVLIAAHLGDLTGSVGDDVLRRTFRISGPGTRDLRCASLLALAKRLGRQATPDLLVGLEDSDPAVKDYAVIGLAGTGGTIDAWKPVLTYLRSVLRRKQRTQFQSEVAIALAYLAQHASEPSRRSELVEFVRRQWVTLDEADWFALLWPEAAPDGPRVGAVPTPDAARIRAWAREHFFSPLGPPG